MVISKIFPFTNGCITITNGYVNMIYGYIPI